MKHPLRLYGIPNCDSVRRARAWLAEHGIEVAFHDFKKQGVPADRLDGWLASAGREALLNRKGTTWKKLSEAERLGAGVAADAARLLGAHPSVVRRPVLEHGEQVTVGFDSGVYRALF